MMKLDEEFKNAVEARRLLRRRGILCVQNRSFEDVQANEPDFWIRAALFEAFPQLLEFEKARRPSASEYAATLSETGFSNIARRAYREVRKRYASFGQINEEILDRKGKSILFELTNAELQSYCDRLEAKHRSHRLIECDLWTVWAASA